MRTGTAKLDLQQAFHAAMGTQQAGFRQPVTCEVQTFWGDYLNVTIPETVSTQIAFHRWYEKDLTFALIECLDRDMVFFDIGAHYGYFTLLAASIVGSGGKVHSFEPTRQTYELLKENTKGHPNIAVNNNAVYSKSTELEFKNLGAGLSAFNSIFAPRLDPAFVDTLDVELVKVKAVSIDDYVESTGVIPNFVKIDAESAEYQILEGMSNTLKKHRPMFTVEVGDSNVEGVRPCKEIVCYALSFGYRVFSTTMGLIAPHHLQQVYGYDNLLFIPENMR